MNQSREKEMKKSVKRAEQNALEMLVGLFDWLDGLEPQPTTEIMAISKMSEAIESKITGILIAASQRMPGHLNYTKDAGMEALARLTEEYAGLSLSGCFSGPLKKAIRLLEQHCKSMGEQGVSRDRLEKMRGDLEDMKRRLDLLRKVKEKIVDTSLEHSYLLATESITGAMPTTAYVFPRSLRLMESRWL